VSQFNQKWQKSSLSGEAGCVEVRRDGSLIRVRDTKDPLGPVLRFTLREWHAFLGGVRNGEFDICEVLEPEVG
jgi:hypothetical protein